MKKVVVFLLFILLSVSLIFSMLYLSKITSLNILEEERIVTKVIDGDTLIILKYPHQIEVCQ